jgi:hypothetical protein
MATDTGGQAFPNAHPTFPADGMTLLDYFAGQAMQSLITIGAESIVECESARGHDFRFPDGPFYFDEWDDYCDPESVKGIHSLACDAYDVAQAMIAEKRRREAEND